MASSAYGTKPSQLASPVPQDAPPAISAPAPAAPQGPPPGISVGAQDISDPTAVPTQVSEGQPNLTQDMKDYGQYLQAHGANPTEISEYLSYLSAHAPAESPMTDTAKAAAGQGKPLTDITPLDATGRALDYAGGIVRGGLAEVAGAAEGKNLVSEKDLHDIAIGKGPNSAEYLKRLGVNEGVTANLPIIGKVSQRDVEGFAGDVITDPLTVIGKFANKLPEAFSVLKKVTGLGADATAEAVGKAIYQSGFSKIDAKMVENGAEPLSKVLLEEGAPTGTTAQLQKKVQAMADTFGKMRDGLYQKATDLGVTVDMEYPLQGAEDFIQKLSQDKRADVAAQAQELSSYLERNFKNAGPVDLATLSQWKTDLYNTLPSSFFKPNGKMTNVGKQFNGILAQDFRTAIVDAGNTAQKGLGDSIEAINSKWGTLLDARKPVAAQVKQAAGKPIVGPVKAAVTAVNPIAGAALEAGDLANTTVVKTTAGKAAMRAGQTGAAGDVARRALINKERK